MQLLSLLVALPFAAAQIPGLPDCAVRLALLLHAFVSTYSNPITRDVICHID
jgi:hypothetical protein